MKTIVATLLYVVQDNKILLARKKKGWREGIYNGVGGKSDPGETVDQTMIRETEEEIGITPTKYEKVAIKQFTTFFKGEWTNWVVHSYFAYEYTGTIAESDEMAPEWFDFDKIPYDGMWDDDKYWLPKVLAGEKVIGYFEFDKDNIVVSHSIKIVSGFDN